jgi:hypothetical protein
MVRAFLLTRSTGLCATQLTPAEADSPIRCLVALRPPGASMSPSELSRLVALYEARRFSASRDGGLVLLLAVFEAARAEAQGEGKTEEVVEESKTARDAPAPASIEVPLVLPASCAARRQPQSGEHACESCKGRLDNWFGAYGMRDARDGWVEGESDDLNVRPESPNDRWCCAACEANDGQGVGPSAAGAPLPPARTGHLLPALEAALTRYGVRELLARSRPVASHAALAAAHAAALAALAALGPAPLPAPAAAEGVGPGAELAAAAGVLRGGQSKKAAAVLEMVARLVAVGAATYRELDTSGVVGALSAWLEAAPPAARRAFLSRFLRLDGDGRDEGDEGVNGCPLACLAAQLQTCVAFEEHLPVYRHRDPRELNEATSKALELKLAFKAAPDAAALVPIKYQAYLSGLPVSAYCIAIVIPTCVNDE